MSGVWLPFLDAAVRRLHDMGFSSKDCRQALRECEEDLNLAALWLSVHATPVDSVATAEKKDGAYQSPGTSDNDFSVTAVEVRSW